MEEGWTTDHSQTGPPLLPESKNEATKLSEGHDLRRSVAMDGLGEAIETTGPHGTRHAQQEMDEISMSDAEDQEEDGVHDPFWPSAKSMLARASIINLNGDLVLPATREEKEMSTPNFFDWKELFPELSILKNEFPEILKECMQVSSWKAWPENHYEEGGNQDWKVFPFVHTFPANDESRRTWVESTCAHCPTTAKLLRRLPNIRTALFSRLGGGSRISGHRGWADLANHVLRCHLPLKVPTGGPCGLWVNGEVRYHTEQEILVFDDSKLHRAFNNSADERLVLIVDMLRPPGIAPGTADGGHTPELDSFISAFR